MIRSMTGYGRARQNSGNLDITVEMKAVNHRYNETFIRIPRIYMQLEDSIRSYLQKQIARGKVEVTVNIDKKAEEGKGLAVDSILLKEYLHLLREASNDYELPFDVSASTILRLPDVVTSEKEDPDIQAVWEALKPVLDMALSDFVAQREKEGAYLSADIIDKCKRIDQNVAFINERSSFLVELYTDKLKARIKQLLDDVNIDEQRLLTEVAIMADRMAVDEEIVRLGSHTENLKGMLESGHCDINGSVPIGKKADFVIQEMNREINTVTSKIGDMDVTVKAIEIKNIIEKIREQIQNIE